MQQNTKQPLRDTERGTDEQRSGRWLYGGSGAPDIQAADHATGDGDDRDVLGVTRHQSLVSTSSAVT